MNLIRIRVSGSAHRIAAGSTLEGLASNLWEAASLEVALFVVGDTAVDKREWPDYVLRDGDDVAVFGTATTTTSMPRPAGPLRDRRRE